MHEQQAHWRDAPSQPNLPPASTLEKPIFSPAPYSPSRVHTTPVYRSYSHSLDPRHRSAAPQRRVRSASEFIRSDFWFHDGNVVVIAGPAAFKVHRGQLERHSEIFLGLFALPQPPSYDQDIVDGCPSVEFHDSPSDVFYFLSALYDGLYFKIPRANDFPAIAAVLRLSTKYMVEPLRIRCLHRLHLDWPPSLHGWDQREAAATDDSGRYLPRGTCPHPILVIHLALEMGVPAILPAAFYDLSRYGPSKVFAGARKPLVSYDIIAGNLSGEQPEHGEPETVEPDIELPVSASGTPYVAPTVPSSTSGSQTVQLSHPFLCKTLRGREASQRYIATFLSRELSNRQPASDCLNRHNAMLQVHCTESFYYIMLNILRSVGGIACGRDADPLFTLVQALEMLSRTDFTTADAAGGSANGTNGEGGDGGEEKKCGLRMCTMCKVDFAKAVAKAREEVWDLLPSWFELYT
ncbi:hypothetical protein D9756_010633 [Leucocoprinus leucothites]|uniref:BTB domain-containing protein n=1 Tax=Leucocoprinus leucothites TaxID=201217 RepID=A0A8H5CTI3_9AGAR|nr:hypothetical protein D9756_010633 [Leucoagaricus leucothites]